MTRPPAARTLVAQLEERHGVTEPIEVLVTVWPDGTSIVAVRHESWHAWGPPAEATDR